MKKTWPNYYPSGKRVPAKIRKQYMAELRKVKSRSQARPRMKGMVGGRPMAKKRRKTRYITRTVKKYRKSGGAGSFNFQKMAMPLIAATVAEPFVDNVAKQLPIPSIMGVQPDDATKVALAWYFKNKGGLAGNTIKLMGLFGLRNIVNQLMGNVLRGGVPQQDVFASSPQGF